MCLYTATCRDTLTEWVKDIGWTDYNKHGRPCLFWYAVDGSNPDWFQGNDVNDVWAPCMYVCNISIF